MKSGFIRPADITSFSKDQMLTNTALNFAGDAGVNAVLSSKTANVLGNKIANVYRGIRGKEQIPYSNIRRGVSYQEPPTKTVSEILKT